MAELLLVTSDRAGDTNYKDGDTIHAMNDLRIHFVHAEHICRSWNLDKKTGKWVDAVLAENYLAKIYRYKTERISPKEIRITDQWTLESIIKSDVTNQYGHVIDVPLFFNRRLASTPYLVFGSPGAEVFYHGKSRYLSDEDIYIWQQIEARTPNLKADFGQFPWGKEDQKDHLAITVDDFGNAESAELETPLYDDKQDPPVMTKRRKYRVDWQNLPGLTAQNITDIEMVGLKVDIRNNYSFTRSQIVEEKSVLEP